MDVAWTRNVSRAAGCVPFPCRVADLKQVWLLRKTILMLRLYHLLAVLLLASVARAQDMPLSQVLIDGESWREAAKGYQSIQGLAADAAGNIYIADPGSKRVDRLDGAGKVSRFAETEAGIRGLFVAADGKLYGCQPDQKRIVSFDDKGKESVVAEDIVAHDLVLTSSGVIYCTVPSEHAVYMVMSGQKRKVDEGIAAPSGVTLWVDQGTLVVGDAAGQHLWAFRIDRDGTLSQKDRYYTMRVRSDPRTQDKKAVTPSGAAGMTEDLAFRLYAAGTEGVHIYDPTGRLNGVLLKPGNTPPSAVAFGGAGHDVLYMACGDKVFARRTLAKGAYPRRK